MVRFSISTSCMFVLCRSITEETGSAGIGFAMLPWVGC